MQQQQQLGVVYGIGGGFQQQPRQHKMAACSTGDVRGLVSGGVFVGLFGTSLSVKRPNQRSFSQRIHTPRHSLPPTARDITCSTCSSAATR